MFSSNRGVNRAAMKKIDSVLVNGDHFQGGCSTLLAEAGYPHITIPAGYVRGLPIGISFIGGAYQEPTLFRLAFAYESASRHRQPPRLLPTAEM